MEAQLVHHEIFSRFKRWNGYAPPECQVDFLGTVTRMSFVAGMAPAAPPDGLLDVPYPPFDEEYFEWISLLEAVSTAREQFTMIEAGAGFGRWLVRAALAVRACGGLQCKLVGVEAEPTHFQWMKQHFTDNGIDPERHELVNAAISARDGNLLFLVGIPDQSYGQRIAKPTDPHPRPWFERWIRARLGGASWPYRPKRVLAVSLQTLLRPLSGVDLVDFDVQGEELAIVRSALADMDAKVRRVHIATHDADTESGLRFALGKIAWKNIEDYPSGSESPTPWGTIRFQDGVQTWANPRLW